MRTINPSSGGTSVRSFSSSAFLHPSPLSSHASETPLQNYRALLRSSLIGKHPRMQRTNLASVPEHVTGLLQRNPFWLAQSGTPARKALE